MYSWSPGNVNCPARFRSSISKSSVTMANCDNAWYRSHSQQDKNRQRPATPPAPDQSKEASRDLIVFASASPSFPSFLSFYYRTFHSGMPWLTSKANPFLDSALSSFEATCFITPFWGHLSVPEIVRKYSSTEGGSKSAAGRHRRTSFIFLENREIVSGLSLRAFVRIFIFIFIFIFTSGKTMSEPGLGKGDLWSMYQFWYRNTYT